MREDTERWSWSAGPSGTLWLPRPDHKRGYNLCLVLFTSSFRTQMSHCKEALKSSPWKDLFGEGQRPQPTTVPAPQWQPTSRQLGRESFSLSAVPSWWYMMQKLAIPTEPCPYCRIMSKTNDCSYFKLQGLGRPWKHNSRYSIQRDVCRRSPS